MRSGRCRGQRLTNIQYLSPLMSEGKDGSPLPVGCLRLGCGYGVRPRSWSGSTPSPPSDSGIGRHSAAHWGCAATRHRHPFVTLARQDHKGGGSPGSIDDGHCPCGSRAIGARSDGYHTDSASDQPRRGDRVGDNYIGIGRVSRPRQVAHRVPSSGRRARHRTARPRDAFVTLSWLRSDWSGRGSTWGNTHE